MLPVLKLAANGPVKNAELVEPLGKQFSLTPEELQELTPDKTDRLFINRIGWARAYLKQANLVESTKWGYYQITESGRSLLANPPERLDVKFLRTIPAYINHVPKSRKGQAIIPAPLEDNVNTPEETLKDAYERITTAVANDLIDRLRISSPAFFERSIVSLLLAMGYGGSSEEAGRAIGQSGDDGVDGVIDQDPLGVDQIYVQAKRYAEGNLVGPAAIREFAGSLSIKKAQKGIFVTTSGFTKSAVETAKQIAARIVLIDADELGRLLVRHNVGCRDQEVLHIKRIDEDFFE